jgi:hypothetical protein
MSVALLPPKPNEFVRAVRRMAPRGSRMRSKVQAGSGVTTLTQGGRNPPRSAIRQMMASTAPAPPSRWPIPPLVLLTRMRLTASPAQR